jgi:hypothetical protein
MAYQETDESLLELMDSLQLKEDSLPGLLPWMTEETPIDSDSVALSSSQGLSDHATTGSEKKETSTVI